MNQFNPFKVSEKLFDFLVLCFICIFMGFSISIAGAVLVFVSRHFLSLITDGFSIAACGFAAWGVILVYDKRLKSQEV